MARLDALIMPSAVAPSPDTPHQALIDPNVRLKQTVKAISHWVKRAERGNFQVLVVDNTKYGDVIRESLPKRVANSKKLRIIDIPPVGIEDIRRGKGAGETSTLIAALAELNLPGESYVAKVNARYKTSNGLYLISKLSDEFDFAAWPRRDFSSVDSTFFVGKVSFLTSAFEYVYRETDDMAGKFVEILYADYSIRNPQCSFERFDFTPSVIAQSGSTGDKTHFLSEARVVSMVIKFRAFIYQVFSRIKQTRKAN